MIRSIGIISFVSAFLFATMGFASTQNQTATILNLQLTAYGFQSYPQGTVTIFGEGFAQDDEIILIDKSKKRHHIPLFNIRADGADFSFPKLITSGSYALCLKRSEHEFALGETNVTILKPFSEIPQTAGIHIQGYVRCGNQPIPKVVVTDGHNVTLTDHNGIYKLPGHANAQFVIISLPSGFEAATINNIPAYFHRLVRGKNVQRHDFSLYKVDNTKHVVITPADIHLSNRFNRMDIEFFKKTFIPDANALIESYRKKGFRPYILPLGDMTSDRHWYMDLYNLSDYVKEMRPMSAPIFNCMGNHDNDIRCHSDWEGEQTYRDIVGPNYYSFNLGKIHYVVLDNTIWLNPLSKQSAMKNGITQDQVEWLKKDLQSIDKKTPVYLAVHCQLASLKILGLGLTATPITDNWESMFDALKDFETVHFFSGHTHVAYNTNFAEVGYPNIYEHNTPGASGLWWWPTFYDGAEICDDGSPAGYGVIEINGNDARRYHKAYAVTEEKPFRSYDRNQIHITAEKYLPDTISLAIKTKFNTTVGEYFQKDTTNEILINAWDFGPGWSISVKENGIELPITRTFVKDPLKMLVYCAQALIKEGKYPNNSVARGASWHIFSTHASSPISNLEITLTDDRGRKYVEHMQRPKAFHKRAYL